jgi:hypothetical protein
MIRLDAIMSAAEVIAAKGWMSKYDAASMMARCLLAFGHSSHAVSVMMRMGSCHAEVWHKIFRKSLVTALEDGGQDELLRAVFDFQSQIKGLETVLDRGVLFALLNQETVLLGLKNYHPQSNSGSFDVDNHQESTDSMNSTLSLSAILNSFASSSCTPPFVRAPIAAASRSQRLKGSASPSSFVGDAARVLQSKLAAATLNVSPDEASHVHARVVRLMSPASLASGDSALPSPDKLQQHAVFRLTGNGSSFMAPSLMRDVVRLCVLACDTGARMLENSSILH